MGVRCRRRVVAGLIFAGLSSGTAATAAEVVVTVSGVRGAEGSVACALFADADGFPKAGRQAAGRRIAAAEGSVVLVFEDVPPGDYAVAAYHDEDDDGVLDTGALGVPEEGLAFSNGQEAGVFGPPGFDAAKVAIGGGGGPVELTLEIRYQGAG